MEIRRFGIGHRRKEGPPGTRGVAAQVIHTDSHGHVAELAFVRDASIVPHTNPNNTWFIVIEGGGFVRVGDEQARIAAGEAVLWPPNVLHAAWTEQTPMRAIVVELPVGDEVGPPHLQIEGRAVQVLTGRAAGTVEAATPERGQGALAPKPPVTQAEHVSAEQEPW